VTANLQLTPVNEPPAVRGFVNLFRKENRAWWGTRRWWINALIWPVILCGLLANILFVPTVANLATETEIAQAGGIDAHVISMGISVFFEFGTTALAIGAVILAQDLVIGEKQNGVAEWLLSKPIARRAYILAKIAANLIPVIILMIGLPSLVGYLMFSIRNGSAFPLIPFFSGLGITLLSTAFYLCLTITLGTIFDNRGPVLGIALGSILGGSLLASVFKPLLYVTPWILPKYASLIANGQPIPAQPGSIPLIATGALMIIAVLISLVNFQSSEY
jgi:ABC-2 type transport system permease protein